LEIDISSDNFIAVFSSADNLGRPLRWYVGEGLMSSIENPKNEEVWKKHVINSTSYNNSYPTRESALVAAHDLAKKTSILEYGVVELNA
jgi:hypothetical protein